MTRSFYKFAQFHLALPALRNQPQDWLPGVGALKWSIPGSELVDGETVMVPIVTHEKSVRTRKLDIGERRGWLFNKALFRQRGVVDEHTRSPGS